MKDGKQRSSAFRRLDTMQYSLLASALLLLSASLCIAEDWPTHQHDARRSASSSETLDFERIHELWVHRSSGYPQTAWSGPAKWDAYAEIDGLRSMRNYDPVFHVTAAENSVFWGSSSDDSVYCVDSANGEERWSYVTGGPVRLPPTYVDGRVYFGSDDGYAYCLDAESGNLVWRYSPVSETRLIPNNGKMISLWPCRSGVVVQDGTAYFACAMLPWEESYLCAVNAETGQGGGKGTYRKVLERVTMEGAMVASETRLYVPQGRRSPMVFDRQSGAFLGTVKGGGGVFVLLTPDLHFYHGPGNKTGWITDSHAKTRDQIATYEGGNYLVVAENVAYILTDTELFAVDRVKKKTLWRVGCDYPYCLILAGDVLLAGGDYEVAAFRTDTGEPIWSQAVDGRAYGLAVAEGNFYVSTHTGIIHAFSDR